MRQMNQFGPNFTHTITKCVIEEIDKSNEEIFLSELMQRINMKNSRFYRNFVKFAVISPKYLANT